MKDKRFIHLLAATNDCPLSFTARYVYSCLATWTSKFGRGASISQIAERSGLDRHRAIPKALKELTGHGMVKKRSGRWLAEDKPEFFKLRKNQRPRPEWHRKYAYIPLYLPTPESPLTPRQNTVLWFLESRRWPQRSILGIAVYLGIDRKTAESAVAKLRDLGLVDGDLKTTDLPAHAGFWQDITHPQPPNITPGWKLTDDLTLKLDTEEFRDGVNKKLDVLSAVLLRNKFTPDEIVGHFDTQLRPCGGRTTVLLGVLNNWSAEFNKAQSITEKNRQLEKFTGKNCLGLLDRFVSELVTRQIKQAQTLGMW